jgi:hypothetical protein
LENYKLPPGVSRVWNHPPIVTSVPFDFEKDGLYIREAFKAMADQISIPEWVTIFKIGKTVAKALLKLEEEHPNSMRGAFQVAWDFFRKDYVDKL